MAHHLGIATLPGPMFTVPMTGRGLYSPIPPILDDVDHVNGMTLEPASTADRRARRANWNPSTGALARLVGPRR